MKSFLSTIMESEAGSKEAQHLLSMVTYTDEYIKGVIEAIGKECPTAHDGFFKYTAAQITNQYNELVPETWSTKRAEADITQFIDRFEKHVADRGEDLNFAYNAIAEALSTLLYLTTDYDKIDATNFDMEKFDGDLESLDQVYGKMLDAA